MTPVKGTVIDKETLKAEKAAGKTIGIITLGKTVFFFRRGMKMYYIPNSEVHRAFRRVMDVEMKVCCGKGSMPVEYLVICDSEERELAQIQLPGTKAAHALMDEIKERMPDTIIGKKN